MSYMRDADNNRLDGLHIKTRLDALETTAGDLQSDLDTEAGLARDASNLTTGTIPDARIPAGITRDSELAAALAALVNAAPSTLDTLKELADALGDDPNFAATMTAALATKATTAALTTETTNRTNADNNEAATRSAADDAISARLDTAIAERRQSLGAAVIGQLGASISVGGTLSYYNATTSGCISYGAISPMGHGLAKTKGRWTAGGVAATAGFTTAQMISTHLPTVLTTNWDYCIVGEVTNDLGNGVAIATTQANITSIVNQLLAAGIIPILTTVPPSNSNTSGAGLTWITQYNEWVKRRARELRLPLIDYHAALVSASANGYISGTTSDGTHPVANGAVLMGQALADTLNSIPGPVGVPLASSYNPNRLIPDACATSAGSDKIVPSGVTTGGWCFGAPTSTRWKGNASLVVRGSGGDYQIAYPVTGSLVAGHRVRLAFGIEVQGLTIGSGTWSAYLYNVTQSQVIAGYSAITHPLNDGTATVATDAAVTSAANTVTCSTSKPFRQNMVGNNIAVLSGVSTRFAAGTTIIGVSEDGSTAYCSANSAATASAQTVVVMGQPQVSCFEFDVQSDMVGDTLAFIMLATGAATTSIAATQVTLTDLTALGAA